MAAVAAFIFEDTLIKSDLMRELQDFVESADGAVQRACAVLSVCGTFPVDRFPQGLDESFSVMQIGLHVIPFAPFVP